ncbi:MAG TPA: ELWxxDGT repeat protein [Thermoanaerobaculia bacterium]|jgi:ELWxxDGT repeat protein|nr:ELWxxDGT repeat protein [Thermoanaerobaculia bacterium]
MGDTGRWKAISVLLLLLLSGVGAWAQPGFLVKDLNTTRADGIVSEGWSFPADNFVAVGGTVFFAASDGIHGSEPWRSDGTEAGTRLVADICPGACASTPKSFAVVGDTVFFVANDGFHGPELWKSDGTAAGTVLVKDLTPTNQYVSIGGLVGVNGVLIFSRWSFGETALWRSDGTEAGTFPVANVNVDFFLEPQVRLGGKLFFAASDKDHGWEYWTTDGTAAGTVLLKDIALGKANGAAPQYFRRAAVAGGRVFFTASGPEGMELWASDGTEAGTVLVKDITPGSGSSSIENLTALGGEVFFFLSTSGQDELWASDGTAGGTRPVKAVPWSSTFLTTAGGRLFFFSDCDLWTSDGSAAGTVLVRASVRCYPSYPLIDNGKELLFFGGDGAHGLEPWKSDGTPAGTSLIADLNPGINSSTASGGEPGLFVGGRWYFRAKAGEGTGTQLWTSDGTAAGTRMLEINHQKSGMDLTDGGDLLGPRAFSDLDGILLFQGDDGVRGAELWRSDGTAGGTSLVKDLRPGPYSSAPGEITPAWGTTYFRSDAGLGDEKLWKTDGTPQGTEIVVGFGHSPDGGFPFSPRDLTPLGADLLFLAGPYGPNDTLLKTDGTWQGTEFIGGYFDYVDSLVSLGDKALFQVGGNALWKTDGTSPGTVSLGTLLPADRPLLGSSAVRDGVLFFAGSTPETGEELWRSDGTPAGTYLLNEFVPGAGSKRLGPFAVAGPAVFFAAGGNELWKNGAGGTSLVRALPAGDPALGIRSLTALGEKVYFTHDDGVHGDELWVSDGTDAGTRMVEDILPGPGSSHPRQLHAEGALLLFSASDGVHGFEPWRSNGTELGTRMLQDIAPGDLPSSPTEFTASGPNVYFAANDGTAGFELWAFPRPSLLATFADVPVSHWSWSFVEALVAARFTGGCAPDSFCPERMLTRAEVAVFLVRAIHGPLFVPPGGGSQFQDVPASHWAAPWVEQIAADGVMAGCGGANFCPEGLVNRAEIAGLLLRAKHGSGFVPPPAMGTVFNDVPASYWAASWIEELAAEGGTIGCGGGNYCPEGRLIRAEMAVFLTRMFGLPRP